VLPIQLWKANANGFPKLPIGVPSLVPYCPIWGHDVARLVEKEKLINAKISKHVEIKHGTTLRNLCDENEFVCGLLEGYFITFVKTFSY
jgi:hypothetical protein